MAGDIASPNDHTAAWIGDEVPHRQDGRPMDQLIIDQFQKHLVERGDKHLRHVAARTLSHTPIMVRRC